MRLVLPRLYVILDAALSKANPIDEAKRLADAGVRLLQYRDKNSGSGVQLRVSTALAEGLVPQGVTFLMNDRPDVAWLAGASGVHVGQEDLGVEAARHIVGKEKFVGVSTHNLEQFRKAADSSADYIAVGPIFPTHSKRNPDPVVGIELLRQVRLLTSKPIVAIGGITLETAQQVIDAGADSVAVISDILMAENPGGRARLFVERLGPTVPGGLG
jgi:thiamine-phosphate pyrophosphorylase